MSAAPRPPRGTRKGAGPRAARAQTGSAKSGIGNPKGGGGGTTTKASERKGLWRHLHNVPLPGSWEPHRAENDCLMFRNNKTGDITWIDKRYPLPKGWEEHKDGLKSMFINTRKGNQVKWDPRAPDVRNALEFNNLPLPKEWEPRRTPRGHIYFERVDGEGDDTWTDPRNPLPPNWTEDKTEDGLSVFTNDVTGAMTHADPRAYEADPLPEGWRERVDPNGLIYYEHCDSGHMQWLDPSEPPLPPQWGMDRDETGKTIYRYHFNGGRTTTDPRIVPLAKLRGLMEKKPIRGNIRNHYKPVKALDRGGFAKLHIAEWKHNGDESEGDAPVVALKDIPIKGPNASPVQTAINEATLHAALFHPNIVKLEDYAVGEKHVTLVLELCHGGTLHNVIQSRRPENNTDGLTHYMPEEMILTIFRQILDAVSYLHANGILHLDLKTGNVLFDRTDQAKLCDFGLATWTDRVQKPKNGQFTGTIEYSSPEILLGSSPTTKADVWSLGVMLYTMAALEPPWPLPEMKGKKQEKVFQESFAQMRGAICAEQHPPLAGPYSDDFRDILKKMLSKKTRFRPEVDEILAHPIFAPSQ